MAAFSWATLAASQSLVPAATPVIWRVMVGFPLSSVAPMETAASVDVHVEIVVSGTLLGLGT